MSFVFGLFLGFNLGVLCMAMLFLARDSEAPPAPLRGKAMSEMNLSSEAPAPPFHKD